MTTTTSFKLKLPKFMLKEAFDVYTLGVSLIQIINNKSPTRQNRFVVEEKKKFYDPVVLEMIARMVAVKPEDRPTCAEIRGLFFELYYDE